MAVTRPAPSALLLWLILVGTACATLGYKREPGDEDEEVILYGSEAHPGNPPDACKRLAKIEVSALESKGMPERKLEIAALDAGGNAVGHIRKAGFSDGYLGKEYNWRAVAFDCPVPKRPASAAAPASAAPAASGGRGQ